MGFNQHFPWYDPFGEVTTNNHLSEITTWIDEQGPQYIILDAPSSALSIAAGSRHSHMLTIVNKLANYDQVSVDPNWMYYERKGGQLVD